jgi:polyhydroxybutyrate depolymerase
MNSRKKEFFAVRIILSEMAFACALGAAPSRATAAAETIDGREALIHVPAKLPARGKRALVLVLHGGMGNASRIEGGRSESGLRLDDVADKDGFLVAYLNGTPVTRRFGPDMLGWNAGGGCCGVPAQENVDDVGYVRAAVGRLIEEYGVDPARVYGLGHSNGAMMAERLMCEADVFAAVVAVSGPLNLDVDRCLTAKGKRVLSIHGAEDKNVPIEGGQGSVGLSRATYKSEARTRKVYADSGADFRLLIVAGAEHKLDDVDAKLRASEGVSLAEKSALFFGLAK